MSSTTSTPKAQHEATAPAARRQVAPAAGQPSEDIDPDGPLDVGNTGRIGVSAWKPATT
ncbi:hypothetical protein [Micromonospora sp. ALFpr18c]|uniref:hypothetical protein n=1 Tax=Micromonospora sp. ALFpr18c TaxID=1458665 RepID=UPI001788C2C6|nr:hypothetical protein [Micromonospora sp. ALFpr18c]